MKQIQVIDKCEINEYYKEKQIIIQNLDKPLIWHINNFSHLNSKIGVEKIKNILKYEKEKNIPNDDIFLSNIYNIKLPSDYFNLNINKSFITENIPFCFNVNKIVNINKNFREEKYVIFTSQPQIEIFSKSKEFIFDCDYKICPNGYSQVLSILVHHHSNYEEIFPVFIIPMSHKSEIIYTNIFNTILSLVNSNNYGFINNNKKKLFCEYEGSMRVAIRNVFKNIKIFGTYHHYIKKLWIKAKKLGLCTEHYIKYSKLIILCLEMIPFLKSEDIKSFLADVDNYVNQLQEDCSPLLKRYLSYYKNLWKIINYIISEKNENHYFDILKKNYCEKYNLRLYNLFNYYYPKMPIFVDMIKDLIKSYSKSSTLSSKISNPFNTYYNIYSTFFFNHHLFKEKQNVKFKDIIKSNGVVKLKINKIILNNMKCFFGLQCISSVEDKKDYSKNKYNFNEIEKIIPQKYYDLNKSENYEKKIKTYQINSNDNPYLKEINEQINL